MSEISHVCEPGDLIITMCAPGGCVELGLGQVDACVQMKICALCTVHCPAAEAEAEAEPRSVPGGGREGAAAAGTGHTGT